jgi:peptidoglycan lytic transglycosylase
MHLRRTIGISLAFLVASTGAIAKTAEKSASHHPGHPCGVKPQKAEHPTGKPHAVSHRRSHGRSHARYATRQAAPAGYRAASAAVADDSGAVADTYIGSAPGLGRREFGKAAWYNFVGGHTATGERLDTVTATAAHRTLPLSSYAKVTNLDSGRSVIVKINDRGPWTRRFIIDLSPRAADMLEMKRAGVASVMVEPIPAGTVAARSTLATFQNAVAIQ